jgi:hypothetical protein
MSYEEDSVPPDALAELRRDHISVTPLPPFNKLFVSFSVRQTAGT